MLDPVIKKLGEDYRPKLLALSEVSNLHERITPIDSSHIISLMTEVAYPKTPDGNWKLSFNGYCLAIKDLQNEIDRLIKLI